MNDETRIAEILAQAEEDVARGREPDLNALCQSAAHLLPEVQRRLQKLRAIDAVRDPDRRPVPVPAPASAPALPPGYERIRELGSGNMGVVYLARDAKGRAVAVKTLSRLDPVRLASLRREFKTLVGVRHDNLVRIFEEVSDGVNWYCVMEYVEGRPFLDHLRSWWTDADQESTAVHAPAGVSHNPRFREVFAQLALGVHALHAAGILHRDIKSSNVLVSPSGRVKLLDFGLVAELDRLEEHQQSAVVGTVAYMSPEQCGRGHLTPASDWYSFGVLLYQALTGQLPFTGTIAEVFTRKATGPPRRPSELAFGVPGDLEALCLDLLRTDPVARPAGAEVLRRLGVPQDSLPARRSATDRRPLVGRDRHLRELREASCAVREGRTPGVVEVHGPSGVGKTALVERFLQEVQESGEAFVLAGRCYEQSSVPYKAFDGVMDAVCRHLRSRSGEQLEAVLPNYLAELARLFPVLGRLEAVSEAPPVNVDDPHEIQRRAFRALRELFGRLGRRATLVVFVDDLQWGDRESAGLLAELVRAPDAPPLLFVASFRPVKPDGAPFVAGLRRLPVPRRELAVGPLSETDTRELAAGLMGPDADRVEALTGLVAGESRGNPFLVQQMVEFFRSRGSATPPTIDAIIRYHTSWLDEESRRLLEVIAVSVGPVNVESAFRSAEIPPERQAAALDTLLAGRGVQTTGRGEARQVEVYHNRIRETLVAGLPPEVRTRHHRRLAVVLKAAGETEAEDLAYHFAQAGEWSQASAYFARAGDQAARALAFDRAAEQYRAALDGCPANDPRRRDWLAALAAALANGGQSQPAAATFLEAAGLSSATESLFCRQRAAEQFIRCGQIDEGMAILREVLAGAGIAIPATERAVRRSLFWLRLRLRLRGMKYREQHRDAIPAGTMLRLDVCRWASGVIRLSDVLLGSWFHSLGLLLSLRAGWADGIAHGLARESVMPNLLRPPSAARLEELHALGLEVAARVADPQARNLSTAVLHFYRAAGYHFLGDARRSLAEVPAAQAALDRCAGESAVHHRGMLRMFEALSRLCLGDVEGFRAVVTEHGRRTPAGAAHVHGEVTFPLVARTHQLHLIDDAPDDARRVLETATGQGLHTGLYQQHLWAWIGDVDILLYEGQGRRAWEVCEERWGAVARRANMMLPITRCYGLWTRARSAVACAAQLGGARVAERQQLLREARAIARQLASTETPSVAPALGWSIDAAAAHLLEQPSVALERVGRAEAAFARGGWMLHALSLACRRGQLTGGEAGRGVLATATAELAGRGVRNPPRFAAVYAPGFRD